MVLSAENVSEGVLGAGVGGDGGTGVTGGVEVLPPFVPLEFGPPHAVKTRIRKIAMNDERSLTTFVIPDNPLKRRTLRGFHRQAHHD
jgi:hypothetical protein